MHAIKSILISLGLIALSGCTILDHSHTEEFTRLAKWVVLPVQNYTETPQAGRRAQAITAALLHSNGVSDIQRFLGEGESDVLADPSGAKVMDDALAWAKKQGARYAVTGTVDEWRYKVGVEGEPAVGMTLQIMDVESGMILWSATGAKTGWHRDNTSAVAQKLIKGMLADLALSK